MTTSHPCTAVAFTVIRLGGAAYLVYLGVKAVRHRHRALAVTTGNAPARQGAVRAVADGVVVGVLNPKTVVFFVAFLPQFVDRSHAVAPQIVVLGAVFAAIAMALDSVWVVVAGTARHWLARSPRRLAAVGGTGGLAMIGLGAGLAFSGRASP